MTIDERAEVGRKLGFRLAARAYERPVVLALSRAARPIAIELARVLGAPVDDYGVSVVGPVAIVEDGSVVYDARLLALVEAPTPREVKRAWLGLRARMRRLRGDRTPLEVARRTVILVEDSPASVAAVQGAARSLVERGPARVVLATPLVARLAACVLASAVDEIETLEEPLLADASVQP